MKNVKKLSVPLIILCIITAMISCIFGAITTNADIATDEAMYLLDEDFSFLAPSTTPNDIVPSGWDVRRAGGSISYGFNSWFKVSDTSTVLPVSLTKKILTQSSGSVTLEYRFKMPAIINGVKWQLRNGETEAVSVVTNNGNLCLETGGSLLTLQKLSANTEYGVKVVADITNGKTQVYVNGTLKADNKSFKNTLASIDNFKISTGDVSTGDVFLSPVKIYKGYIVNEKFISTVAGFLPSDWVMTPSGGVIAVEQMDNMKPPDVYSLKMNAASANGIMSMEKTIPSQDGSLVFEFKALFQEKADGFSMELKGANTSAFKFITSDGKLCYQALGGTETPFYDYLPNLWYHFKIKLDTATSKADIYLNSKLVKKDAELFTNNLDSIKFSIGTQNKSSVSLDDILLYKASVQPQDYVPEPQKVTSGSQLIGIQSCSMWREGQHLGWDRINPYSERTPLLGYYDEGNPEEADWEIKWLAEHGIDYEMFCWYRSSNVQGKPLKEPRLGAALHEGYFNAKYSDMLKFAISWENSTGAKDSNDFRTNIIPYWVEYYLKDSRYLVIDNKPVIGFYSYAGLKRDFGGTVEGVKAEMDYLRNVCKGLGFDDAILLVSYSVSDPATMSEMKAAGLDAVFAYSWGQYAGKEALQKTKLEQQKEAGSIDVIPVLSMGRDDRAWNGAPGYYATSEELQSTAQWVKDTFIPSLQEGSVGRRTVLLDNWNEYGEGHFFMPAQLNGFGYLDAIRNVFAGGGTHTDIAPSQAQKDRIDVLYPSGRKFVKNIVMAPQITDTYSRFWNFDNENDSEGWTIAKQIENQNVSRGSYSGTSTGSDPGIFSPDNLGIIAEDNPFIHIRMKNSANDTTGKIYFITEDDQKWNEAKAIEVFINPCDSSYTDYYVPMWNSQNWTGIVKAVRFDPISSTGSFSIDEIGFVYSIDPGIKVYIDGKKYRTATQPQYSDNSVMVPVSEILSKIKIATEWDTDKTLITLKDGNIIKIIPGQTTAYKGSTTVTLEKAPVLIDGDLLVSTDALEKLFGYIVSIDQQTQILAIYTSSLIWDFISSDGWTSNAQIINTSVQNGYYKGTITGTSAGGNEAYISSKDQLNIGAEAITRIRIKYRNETEGNEMKLYFTTLSDNTWNQAKMIALPAIPSDSQYREYVFDTYSMPSWNGIIKQLRFVPSNSDGSFSIDSIVMDTTRSTRVVGENILTDPGMEKDTVQYTGSRVTMELSNTEYHTGHQSLKIIKGYQYAKVFFPGVENNKEYYYSAWGKLDPSSTNGEKLRICLSYNVGSVGKQVVLFEGPAMDSASWKQVQGYFKLNETGNISNLTMYIYTDSPAAADTYYLDDVEIRPVTYTDTPAWVHVSGISLNRTSTTIGLGKVQNITASVAPADATNRAVRWSSDNTDVAIVDQNGFVYGKSEGTANITATTEEGGKMATCAVTVKEGVYETVTLTVKPDGTGDFLSPKLANDSITDSSVQKRYVIEVYPGVYTETNWVVKQYTTIRGTDRDNCWLKGEKTESATNNEITNTSTVWLQPTANLENLKITSKNMRYPVHSEASGSNRNAVHNITNCYIEHYGNLEAVQYRQRWVAAHPGVTPSADLDPAQVWGGVSGVGSHAWGYGSASGLVEDFNDCTFVSKSDGWYVHNNKDFTAPQINTINNSKIISTVTSVPITVQSLGSGTKDQVIFNNCEITGTYIYQNDWPWLSQKTENQYANHADYTVTLTGCTPIGYMDGHRGSALAIFSNSTGSTSNVRVSGDAVADILGQYTTKDGGGKLKGYIYGYWDISGIKVGLNSDIVVNNTLGRRLGNCTGTNKTLNVTFEDGTTKSIVFNEDYTTQTNAYINERINSVLGSSGYATEYNVTANEYYPQVTDKQMIMTNTTNVGIPRFSAVCYNSDTKSIRLMKSTDSASMFLGITLEGIAPGQSGRVLTVGIMHKTQLSGFSGSIGVGTKVSISSKDGCFEVNAVNPAVMKGAYKDWAYFCGNTAGAFDLLNVTVDKTVLKTGDTAVLTITASMNNGTAADMTKTQKVYTSNNEQVVTVGQDGTVKAVGEGTAKIKVSVEIGGITKEAEIQLTVDGTPAVTTSKISGTVVNGWYTGDVKVTLSSSDNLSGVDKTEYQLDNSGEWTIYSAPVSITQDGSHIIQYYSTDKAGNGEDIKQEGFKVDITAPVSIATVSGTVYASEHDVTTYNSHVVVALFSEDTAGGSGIYEIQYSLDGLNWLPYTAPLKLTDNGTYSINYKASDKAGNMEAVKNENIIISMSTEVMVLYLKENVNEMSISEGIKQSFTSKLDSVLGSIFEKDNSSTVNKLNAFINEVEAQTGKKLTNEQADKLKTEVNKIFIKINQL